MPSSRLLTLAQKATTLTLFGITVSGAYVVFSAASKIIDRRLINPEKYKNEPILEGSATGNGLPGTGIVTNASEKLPESNSP